jgi:hypothetical protein
MKLTVAAERTIGAEYLRVKVPRKELAEAFEHRNDDGAEEGPKWNV